MRNRSVNFIVVIENRDNARNYIFCLRIRGKYRCWQTSSKSISNTFLIFHGKSRFVKIEGDGFFNRVLFWRYLATSLMCSLTFSCRHLRLISSFLYFSIRLILTHVCHSVLRLLNIQTLHSFKSFL